MKCHICGADTEWKCEKCEEPVCEDCCVPYTQFTQIDYPLCNSCGEAMCYEEARNRQEEEEGDAERKKIKDEKNLCARIKYNSTEQKEKRRLKKIELQKQRAEENRKSSERVLSIMNSMFLEN